MAADDRFQITTSAPARTRANSDGQSLAASRFTALQEQLGLRLEDTRAPVEVLVIDRTERAA